MGEFAVGAESVGLLAPMVREIDVNCCRYGYDKPWKGSNELDGKRIEGAETHTIARMGVALVPQRGAFPRNVRRGQLVLGAAYIPHAKDDIPHQLKKFRAFPHTERKTHAVCGTMSGGQQRMLAIGRASCQARTSDSDEPSLGLQPSIVADVFEVLKGLKSSVSILVAEQNVRESLKAIDRGCVLENGRIVLEDSAEGLRTNPFVIKSYLGL